MSIPPSALLEHATLPSLTWDGAKLNGNGHHADRPQAAPAYTPPDAETLRQVAWDVGQEKPAEAYAPADNHVGLAMVNPHQGYAHYRIRQEWIDRVARERGPAWNNCRLVLRVYDVSYILFNGFNANRVQDVGLNAIAGHAFFGLPRPATWQIAEVGFVLRSGEFIAAARSGTVQFSRDTVSGNGHHVALLVDEKGRLEEVGNLWEQERILSERRKPKLRKPLAIAAFAFESAATGHQGPVPRYVTELAAGQVEQGHNVHVFLPATDDFREDREVNGVHYHALAMSRAGTVLDQALAYARAAEARLADFPAFDLFHLHEWVTGLAPWIGTRPTVLSLSSTEATRLNGNRPSPLSVEIQKTERALAHSVDCLLTPDWLREKAIAEFGIDETHVHAFPMEARLPDEWQRPLDTGKVKMEVGIGPLDRMLLFVGPLEHAAGPDLLVEALATQLHRSPNLRLALAGGGGMHGHLAHRAHQLGVGHAVRLLGHVEFPQLSRLLRAAEAVFLPSRQRVAFDDAVVDLARKAGKPVVTTYGGPAHLVRHEENGLLTYDNPGSMVWAMDRILGDPRNAERLGQNGRRGENAVVSWGEVARHYFELCATAFPELHEPQPA